MNPRSVLITVILAVFLLSACSREYNTELMSAAKNGDVIGVQKIIDRGADVNQQSNKGKTALMFAASEGHRDVAQLLIDHGAKVNIADHYGTTALIVGSTAGKHDIVELLLKHGANPDARDQSGSAPLVNAVYFGHTRTVQLLLPKLDKLSNQDGEELLLLASGLGHADIVRSMIDFGINANARGLKQRTALMAAVNFDKPEVVKVLLSKGADPQAKDVDGNTAFSVARDKGYTEILNLLGTTANATSN
ncbi:ankyrin repeat domain-containing protein [Kaarinaea lacus]